MSALEAIFLGLLQGLTEFLPISSSGHLVFFQYLLGLREPLLAFDVTLHIGTLVAVVLYYRKRLGRLALGVIRPASDPSARRLFAMLVAATIPTVVVALAFEDRFERMFGDPLSIGWGWVISGLLLVWAYRFRGGQKGMDEITLTDAVLIGLFQGLAIVPSISRSGATICIAMARGVKAADAADFSFLLSIPAIAGAMLMQAGSLSSVANSQLLVYVFGTVVAGVVGYLSIWALIRLLKRKVILPFAAYCIGMGVLTTVIVLWRE